MHTRRSRIPGLDKPCLDPCPHNVRRYKDNRVVGYVPAYRVDLPRLTEPEPSIWTDSDCNHGFFDDTEQDDLSRQDARLARRCTPFYRAASLRAMCTLMVSATASAECWLVSTVRSSS